MLSPVVLSTSRLAFSCLLILGLTSGASRAANLHLVVVPDTRDPSIGADMVTNQTLLESVFQGNVPEARLNIVEVGSKPGERLDRESVLQAIADLPVGPDDSVVFYYTGHGAYNPDKNEVDQQPFGTYAVFTGNDTVLYQTEIRGAIARLGPKFSAVILDCCNALRPITNRPRQFAAPGLPLPKPDRISPLFQSLFFDPSGTIVLESSAPGEYAFVKPVVVEANGHRSNQGSLFTISVTDVIGLKMNEKLNWEQLAKLIQQNVTAGFKNLKNAQQLVLDGQEGPFDQKGQTVTMVVAALR